MIDDPRERGAQQRRRDGRNHLYAFDIPLDKVASDSIRRFDAYWRAKAVDKTVAGKTIPARSDIDPAEIGSVLPDMILLDVEWEPFRCSIRLRGTRAEQVRPRLVPKYLDEATTFEPGRREDYLAEMNLVATQRRPAFARDYVTARSGLVRDIWAGVWPLAPLGERVNMLVVIEDLAGIEIEDFYPA